MRAPAAAALGGAIVFWWLAGWRVIDPREFAWTMKGDWQIHFLGWHFFRQEPWQWPPGAIRGLYEPIGTTLGFTDSIPLVALLLKPVAAWLPHPFQYLGLWFLVCYTLQAFFGALVISTWTSRPLPQFAGAMLLVLSPALFERVKHPALCAHWLILWALWLNWRASRRNDLAHHAALGLTSGLVHPYLAVMVLVLLAAHAASRRAVVPLAAGGLGVVAGWWASGLLTLSSAKDLAAAGGDFSMNLLSLVNPGTLSALFPPFRFASGNQWDAYHYLGAGGLLLCAIALVLAIMHRAWSRAAVPLGVALGCCAVYSVLPLVAAGPRVLLDLRDEIGTAAIFRATGRFFWPVNYALVAWALGIVATSLRPRVAMSLLSAAVLLQAVDLHKALFERHNGARSAEFHQWNDVMPSGEWGRLLPNYRHLAMYPPEFCRGPVAVPPAVAAFHAGLYGLAVNDGFAARVNIDKQMDVCRQLRADLSRGFLDDETVYLVARPLLPDFKAPRGDAVECREIDAVTACVSSRSIAIRGAGVSGNRNK